MQSAGVVLAAMLAVFAAPALAAGRAEKPIEIRVVVITTWEVIQGDKDFGESSTPGETSGR